MSEVADVEARSLGLGELDRYRVKLGSRTKGVGVRRDVVIRQPEADEGFRTWPKAHPGDVFAMLGEEGQPWLVLPEVADDLSCKTRVSRLVPAVNHNGDRFLLPVTVDPGDDRAEKLSRAIDRVVARAAKEWVRVVRVPGQPKIRCYRFCRFAADIEWGEVDLEEMIRRAFGERIIDSFDHPELPRLVSAAQGSVNARSDVSTAAAVA